jgi:hypothetical protein
VIVRSHAVLLLSLLACGEPPRPVFTTSIRVESDPGVAVQAADVLRDGTRIASTDPSGRATVTFRGIEGEVVALGVACPADYDSPPGVSVRLRRAVDGKAPEYTFHCAPRIRKIAIAVRAASGPNLAVVYLGRRIAYTDALGVAHALVTARPGEQVDLALDTSDRPRLRPQNPSASFEVKSQDDLFVFDQRFTEEKPPPPVHRKPSVPKRLTAN